MTDARARLADDGGIRNAAGVLLADGTIERYARCVDGYLNRGDRPLPDAETTSAIADAAVRFHELAGTAQHVEPAVERLRSGAAVLAAAHQPNTLAGLNVVGLAAIQAAVASGTAGPDAMCVLFLLIDYDDVEIGGLDRGSFPGPSGKERFAREAWCREARGGKLR